MAGIAPTLGQNWLSGQMQNFGNLVGIGINAVTGQASAGQNYANNVSQLLQSIGAANAAAANSSFGFQQFIRGGMAGAGNGAVIGGIIGGLGSLF